MAIQNTQIGGAYTDILEVPSVGDPNYNAGGWAVTTIMFCNTAQNPQEEIYTDGGDTYLDVHVCANGAAAGVGNMVLNNIPIPAGETFTMDTEKLILAPGDVIKAATTSPTNITATVSYMEV
jgi:hypothetical protein